MNSNVATNILEEPLPFQEEDPKKSDGDHDAEETDVDLLISDGGESDHVYAVEGDHKNQRGYTYQETEDSDHTRPKQG